jgi:hypothetical protein
MKRLALLFALLLTPLGPTIARDASASLSIAVTFDRLVQESTAVGVVTPVEQTSLWENGRIYTYSRVHADSMIVGALDANGDAWVRSMGGVVGKVGQLVEGEAVLTVGRPSLLFLHPVVTPVSGAAPVSQGFFEVSARAQGQFAVVLDADNRTRLKRSSAVGAVVAPSSTGDGNGQPPIFATDKIHGRALADAAKDIAAAWSRLHAH